MSPIKKKALTREAQIWVPNLKSLLENSRVLWPNRCTSVVTRILVSLARSCTVVEKLAAASATLAKVILGVMSVKVIKIHSSNVLF